MQVYLEFTSPISILFVFVPFESNLHFLYRFSITTANIIFAKVMNYSFN